MLPKTIILFLLLPSGPPELAQEVAEKPQREGRPAGTAHPGLVPEEALEVFNLTLEGSNTFDFELVNRSDEPITAWAMDLSAMADGKMVSMTVTQDFAISSHSEGQDVDHYKRHRTGPLVPGQSHHHSLRLGSGGATLSDPLVTVRTVVFYDRRSVGDNWFADNFFQNRRRKKRELGQLLVQLRFGQQKDRPGLALREFRTQIGDGAWKDEVGFAQLYDSFAAENLEPHQLYLTVMSVLNSQYEAIAYHSSLP